MAKRKPSKRKAKQSRRTTEWDVIEDALLKTPTEAALRARRRSGPAPDGAGADMAVSDQTEPEVLRRLAQRSRLMRGRSRPIGNVVFLHGITGSDLAVSKGSGKPSSIWVDIWSLVSGHLQHLKLAPDGRREADPTLRVRTTGINKRYYARAVLALRAQWNVEPYAYDWRRDIDEASDGLAAFIKDRFNSEPLHIVAHSMGGLVARNMIHRHPKLWESMRDPKLLGGGRLVMLGTPNYGSFAIPQVMTGADALMARLERFDLNHNLSDLLKITNSFLGTYMLLPAFDKLPPELKRLYESSSWGSTAGISQAHLNRAFDFYKALDTPETRDPQRMVYVAGFNHPTIASMKVIAPGEFEYKYSNDGDGRVPHHLGLLPGVPTLYVDELHGDLARNEDILRSLDEVLQTGSTSQLPRTLPVRAASAPGTVRARNYRAGADKAALDVLEDIASRTRNAKTVDDLSDEDREVAADAFLHAALGARTARAPARIPPSVLNGADSEGERPRLRRASRRGRITLKVGARFGRIEDFSAPVVVVGNYRGIKPVSALGAVNRKMDDWIGRAVKRGMISGHVGETSYVPTEGSGVRAKGVVVAGMGDYGHFSAAALRVIMANVAQGAAALQLGTVATVLVGAGEGNLSVDSALRSLIEGFAAGLLELREERPNNSTQLNTLWIVEYDPKRFMAIRNELENLRKKLSIDDFEFLIVPPSQPEQKHARQVHQKNSERELDKLRSVATPGSFGEVRITVERDREKEEFIFSALTNHAVVPTRSVPVNMNRIERTAKILAEAEGRAEQEQLGRHLFDLIPEDFESLFANDPDAPVRLIVDPTSAALPWEMARLADSLNGRRFQSLGTDRQLTRQFKTLLSRTLGLIPPRNEQVRALVIADPASQPEWQLPGARAEGRLVAKLLREANLSTVGKSKLKLDIVVEERIGSDCCIPEELNALVTSGDFDIIHFAGHGDYSREDRQKSGWVLDANDFLSAVDISRMRKAPWLIVANACYSGALRQGPRYPSLEEARRGASIAEAFMERGVRNYLGTGWTVDDDQAEIFARTFYGDLLTNTTLGKALGNAREKLFEEPDGATWGAYQLYGDPGDQLLPRERVADESWTKPRKPRPK